MMMLKILSSPQSELVAFSFDLLNHSPESFLSLSKGILGVELVVNSKKSKIVILGNEYGEMTKSLPKTKEPLFPVNSVDDVTCCSIINEKNSFFPFRMSSKEPFWYNIQQLLCNVIKDEIVIIQMILRKQKSEHWQPLLRQFYGDYLEGIGLPTKNKYLRQLQYRMLEFIKTKEEWTGTNAVISEVDQKVSEEGYSFVIRFAINGGNKESKNEIIDVIKAGFYTLNYANKWIISKEIFKKRFIEQLQLKQLPFIRSEQILCVSELVPFFITKNVTEALPEEAEIETASIRNEEAKDVVVSEDFGLYGRLPKGTVKERKADIHLPNKLNKTLKKLQLLHDGQNVVVQKVQDGATLRQITFNLPKGLKLSQLKSATDDIQTELALKDIAFSQGDDAGTVVMSIPQDERNIVMLRDCLESDEFQKFVKDAVLPFVLGVDINNNVLFGDLFKTRHLLDVGAQGSGKSVCLNTIILSLMIHKSPKELQLVCIDPKMVELTPYRSYSHVLDVVTDMEYATTALQWVIQIMEDRYKIFSNKGYKGIDQYNKNEPTKLPFLITVIEELADLLAVNGEVEGMIERIAQLGRAAGCLLIIATQYPVKDVLSSIIKRNITTRISFALDGNTAYRVVFDHGLEFELLGKGDGAYKTEGVQGITRFQSAMIGLTDNQTDNIIKHYANQWRGNNIKKIDFSTMEVITIDRDYERFKTHVIKTAETRVTELRKSMGFGMDKTKAYMQRLIDEGILEAPKSRAKGYTLLLNDEQRKNYLITQKGRE